MDAIIGWIGGKRLLRKTISQYVPKDIQGYIEPFGGAAWMLLFKDKWGDLEVYNDLDYRLVNLFQSVLSYRVYLGGNTLPFKYIAAWHIQSACRAKKINLVLAVN